jgi:hypothetical protein
MNNAATEKIAMLRASFRCFANGALSLLPVIGLPFAVSALWSSGRIRVLEKKYWNAARPYRIWGVVCAIIGIVFGAVVFTVYSIILINTYVNS